ncbi:acetylglutamate kinase [Thermovibrio sp.]
MERMIEKVSTLLEALPYIRHFYGKTVVIKYGGNAMVNDELKEAFAQDIVLLKYVGINPVVVHGGGPQIGELLSRLNIESKFVGGMRITDRETMNVVEMVLVGKVNKEIVKLINSHGGNAVGLSGKDGNLIVAEKIDYERYLQEVRAPEIIDLGFVGKVKEVNPEIVMKLLESKFIPVIAPVGIGEDLEAYNINADLVAGEVAAALKAEKLIVLTDTEGIKDKEGNLIKSLRREELPELISSGVVSGGMIPKVKACEVALTSGVKKAHIIDGRLKHSILLEMFTQEGIGTEII